MLQQGESVLWKASLKGLTEIVLLLLHHHAAVDLPNDVRHSYTVDIDAVLAILSHCMLIINPRCMHHRVMVVVLCVCVCLPVSLLPQNQLLPTSFLRRKQSVIEFFMVFSAYLPFSFP